MLRFIVIHEGDKDTAVAYFLLMKQSKVISKNNSIPSILIHFDLFRLGFPSLWIIVGDVLSALLGETIQYFVW